MPSPCFKPGETWNDTAGVPINAHGGGVLWHGGLYHWFGEHKVAGEAGNRAEVGVHVYTSPDLGEWTDAGIALAVSGDPASEIGRGCILERPKVLFNRRTGKFVMWFHLEPPGMEYAGARTGVAVAEAPTGPYRFLRSLRPNAGIWPANVSEIQRQPLGPAEAMALEALELGGAPVPWYPRDLVFRRDHAGGQMARDMTLFQEEDGSAYQVYASENNGTLHISRLSDDYLSHAGHYVRAFPGRYHEAPALMKWRGRTWLYSSDCTGWAPNACRLSVADHILGPWEELGHACLGTGRQIATCFDSQPCFILRVQGRPEAHIFMADRWCPENAIGGRHVWLPIREHHGLPLVCWEDSWDLSAFGP